MVLKKKAAIADLESMDAELHQALNSHANNITGVFEKTFTITEDRFGEMVTAELIPGGADTRLTEENKQEYVDLVVAHFIEGKGPIECTHVGSEQPHSPGSSHWWYAGDQCFTDYRGYTSNDEVIQWFWKCVRSWPPERKSRLLQFATGASHIPPSGLQGSDGPRRFMIEKSGDPSQLPMGHARFHRIDLPHYEDYASLERKLALAIEFSHMKRPQF